ncbi:MAG: hypothetical protein DMD40_05155 [Gemmatimonadetes bacterium]|nr:MAG: hypothetical protein DMD40_05155 [Gemmatimonadota bacterium]
MLKMRVLSLSALLGALACARNSEILVLDPSLRPQTTPQSIRLIAQEPARPYLVVAIVSTRGAVDRARQRLIKEAARLGGHAVLFDSSSLTRIGGDEGQEPQLTGKIIIYTDSARSN